MTKLSLAAVAVLALVAAAPAIAQQADQASDPFVSTQGTTELAVVGGVTLLILIAASTNESSSSSGSD